jgi:hypothetical protein
MIQMRDIATDWNNRNEQKDDYKQKKKVCSRVILYLASLPVWLRPGLLLSRRAPKKRAFIIVLRSEFSDAARSWLIPCLHPGASGREPRLPAPRHRSD